MDIGYFKIAYFKFVKGDGSTSSANFRVNVIEAVDLTQEEARNYISVVDATIAETREHLENSLADVSSSVAATSVAASSMAVNVSSVASSAADNVNGVASNAIESVNVVASSTVNNVNINASNAIDKVDAATSSYANEIEGVATNAVYEIGSAASGASLATSRSIDEVNSVASNAVNQVNTTYSNAVNQVNSAASSATSQANSAASNASSVASSAVSNVSSVTAGVVDKINNLSIGGRNYILNSKRVLDTQDPSAQHNDSSWWDTGWAYPSIPISDFSNKVITLSIQADYDNVAAANSGARVGIEIVANEVNPDGSIKVRYIGNWRYVKQGDSFHGRFSTTVDLRGVTLQSIYIPSRWGQGLYISGITDTHVSISNPKLEIGKIPTDWTPAPEDAPSNDAQLMHKTGNETAAGDKTFTGNTTLALTTILAGNYGLRVTPSGFQKTTDGKTWVSANI